VNNRSLKMAPYGSMCCRASWNERAALMTAIDPATIFRLAIAAQGAALLVQALLAGPAISGGDAALDAHEPVGGAITLISTVQAIAAFPLRRSAQIPRWPLADSIGFLFTDAAQMAAGRLHLLALHLPLGVANRESR
jgi:hypothetical protein